jgi:hypothetical protein
MNKDQLEKLNSRIHDLEEKVHNLENQLNTRNRINSLLDNILLKEVKSSDSGFSRVDSWFNRVGIALLLFGVAFFFKYSIEQGWITPVVRSAMGFILGFLLSFIGYRTYANNRGFSQLMFGGGIATFYITVFASFYLLKLFPLAVSFLLMILITLYSFSLSIRYSEEALSVTAVIGGLGTPFLLYTGIGEITTVVIYTLLILLGSLFIFNFRRWYLLLWTSAAGGWVIFYILYIRGVALDPVFAHSVALQAGIILTFFIFWLGPLVPVIRNKETSPMPDRHQLVFVFSPLILLSLSKLIWTFSGCIWGSISLLLAVFHGLVFFIYYKKEEVPGTVKTQGKVALLLFVLALGFYLEGNILLVVLSLAALTLHYLTHRFRERDMLLGSYTLFIIIRVWVFLRIVIYEYADISPGLSETLANFVSILLLLVSVRFIVNRVHARLFFSSTHVLFMLWIFEGVSLLTDAGGYITILWSLYILILYIVGFRYRSLFISRLSAVTLLLVVGKLFFYDMEQLETIWRVVLFTGIGTLMLAVSFFVQKMKSMKGEEAID